MNKLTQVYLIDETKLKLYSDVARNVGTNKLIPFVALAQPFYIEPILGEPLTAELTLQIVNNSLTEENQALLLKIAPSLALYTQYLGMRGLAYSIIEKGITKLKSENSDSLNEKELAQYIYATLENAERAKELLIKYLCNCKDLYPLWKPETECLCNKYIPTEGTTNLNYEYHIFFPKKKGGCVCK